MHPPPGTPRPAPPRPSQPRRRRRREEQNVLPGKEEHPPDHGEPRSQLPAGLAPPVPCVGRSLASGPREDLPGPAPGPLPSASRPPPRPPPRLAPCPGAAHSCPAPSRAAGGPAGAALDPLREPAPLRPPPSAPGEGSGLGVGGGGEARFLKRRCASPSAPRGASLEAPLGVGGLRGPLLTPPVRPPASGAEMPFPRSPPLSPLPPGRPRHTGSSLSQTKQLRPALSPSPRSPGAPGHLQPSLEPEFGGPRPGWWWGGCSLVTERAPRRLGSLEKTLYHHPPQVGEVRLSTLGCQETKPPPPGSREPSGGRERGRAGGREVPGGPRAGLPLGTRGFSPSSALGFGEGSWGCQSTSSDTRGGRRGSCLRTGPDSDLRQEAHQGWTGWGGWPHLWVGQRSEARWPGQETVTLVLRAAAFLSWLQTWEGAQSLKTGG